VAVAFGRGWLNWAFDSGRSFFHFALVRILLRQQTETEKGGCLPPVYQVGSAYFID
jgi:hypothetical protein